ncbi:MAG TPA: hypothetical protein VGN16_24475 [Acidobacteriaceae bacterium]
MADQENKWWTFWKSVGGITGAVITGVLIYHFTQPKPVATTTPPIVLPQLGLNGFVRDSATQTIVKDALVTVGLGTAVAEQRTDENGQYAFILTGTGTTDNEVSVTVAANGYQHWSGSLTVPAGPQIEDFDITPIATAVVTPPVTGQPANPATPGPPGPVAPVAAAKAGVVFRPLPLNFRKREAAVLNKHQ